MSFIRGELNSPLLFANQNMFQYPEIKTIEAQNLRWYLVDDHRHYPSITSMLGATMTDEKRQSLENWRKSIGYEEADKIGQDAADNGTAIHLLAERYLKSLPLHEEEFTQHQLGEFKGLRIKLKRITKIYGQEVALFSDILHIAGRCDCVCEYEGVPSIIDFKTSLRLKNEHQIEDYKYQLSFYAQAHNEMFGTNINQGVILMVSKDGFPLEFKVNLNKYYDKLLNRTLEFYTKLDQLKD
jgi:ATP-dependent exoDNAse (exonuclease V) beta subunit